MPFYCWYSIFIIFLCFLYSAQFIKTAFWKYHILLPHPLLTFPVYVCWPLVIWKKCKKIFYLTEIICSRRRKLIIITRNGVFSFCSNLRVNSGTGLTECARAKTNCKMKGQDKRIRSIVCQFTVNYISYVQNMNELNSLLRICEPFKQASHNHYFQHLPITFFVTENVLQIWETD